MKDEYVYNIVRSVPRGSAVSYSQIAQMLGNKGLARAVGNALHRNPDGDSVPCFCVVNAKGRLASGFAFGGMDEQRVRLENSGIEVSDGYIDLDKYRFFPSSDGKIICLRPHHLLCFRFFEGKGYSRGFVSAMEKISDRLKNDPEIVLTCSCDAVCGECPERDGLFCFCGDKANVYDERVLKYTGMEYGMEKKWSEFCKITDKKIFSEDVFSNICPDCEWREICHRFSRVPTDAVNP